MRVPAIAALAPFVFVAACSKEPASTTSTSANPATSTNAATPAAGEGSIASTDDPMIGKPAPDFSLTAHDGTAVQLSALKGKNVVVYFYPKDETPGCTKEACSFRDAWEKLAKMNVVMLGVSTDSNESHKAFAQNHKLPFLLLSDPNGDLAKKFGVPMDGTYVARQTFVIGQDGNVKRVYRTVKVANHANEVMKDLGS